MVDPAVANTQTAPINPIASPTPSFFDQAISATKQTEPARAIELLKNLSDQATQGALTWDKNLATTINNRIKEIDKLISLQLAEVMHNEEFEKMEGSWRGLNYLVMNSETGTNLKIKLLNTRKLEIQKDLAKAVEFDQSQLFKKVYEDEFGTPGGEPYAVLICDYEFENTPDDIDMLTSMSGVSAAAFCPLIAEASSTLFGFNSWTELSKPRDLAKIFDSQEYIQWQSFRESEDARFVSLVMPRVLARLPYGATTKPIEEFDYEEGPLHEDGTSIQLPHENYCWMNTAFVMGARLTDAFAKHGWCTAIRGAEGGGKVEGLPTHVFKSDDGDWDTTCPSEVGITDRREAELSRLGFLPLCHYKNTDYAVFFGAQTAQKPLKYDRPDATANAAISARLPYIMAVSRFTHYIKIMARDKIGSFMEASDVEAWLNRWILNYIDGNPQSGPDMKAEYPLAEAKVAVEEVPGSPGSYNAILWLRPWLQMEELTASMRLVARIPQLK